jgi:hypothetical protein
VHESFLFPRVQNSDKINLGAGHTLPRLKLNSINDTKLTMTLKQNDEKWKQKTPLKKLLGLDSVPCYIYCFEQNLVF